jgi:hypothetical protein
LPERPGGCFAQKIPDPFFPQPFLPSAPGSRSFLRFVIGPGAWEKALDLGGRARLHSKCGWVRCRASPKNRAGASRRCTHRPWDGSPVPRWPADDGQRVGPGPTVSARDRSGEPALGKGGDPWTLAYVRDGCRRAANVAAPTAAVEILPAGRDPRTGGHFFCARERVTSRRRETPSRRADRNPGIQRRAATAPARWQQWIRGGRCFTLDPSAQRQGQAVAVLIAFVSVARAAPGPVRALRLPAM